MTTKPYLSAVSLLSLLLLGSCLPKEEDPTPSLPPLTQTGQNTTGAKIDGQVWVPVQGGLFAPPAVEARYRQSVTGNQLNLYFSRTPNDEKAPFNETSIRFYVPDIRRPGAVALNQAADPTLTTSNPAYATFTYAQPSPDQVLITGPGAPGQLVITRLDTVARIVAGTYEFEAREAGGAGAVKVTEGRFDVTY